MEASPVAVFSSKGLSHVRGLPLVCRHARGKPADSRASPTRRRTRGTLFGSARKAHGTCRRELSSRPWLRPGLDSPASPRMSLTINSKLCSSMLHVHQYLRGCTRRCHIHRAILQVATNCSLIQISHATCFVKFPRGAMHGSVRFCPLNFYPRTVERIGLIGTH